eukprot:Nitzschia sp. Nitz4//scaffold196_size54656//29029//30330//NITZ4_006641-RA/size54656-processed-gene-0.52-mRNA-1//1//CDS//3329540432//8100//frame0
MAQDAVLTGTPSSKDSDNNKKQNSGHDNVVLWVTYLNIVLYALSYQLQRPVEPFLIARLAERHGDTESVHRIYGNLQSFFQAIQTIGSPLVGILLDRIGIRNTSMVVFASSALSYALLAQAKDWTTLFGSKIPTIFQAAFLVAQATAATSTSNPAARAAALGRMTTAYTIGATLGPTIGGYLADQGDYSRGAYWAVLGSLISVVLSFLFLPNTTTPDSKKRSFGQDLVRAGGLALRRSIAPLLMVKVFGGVVASIHSTAMPLVLTEKLEWKPSQLGMSMSGSMIAVAALGAVGMAPLTNVLGSHRMMQVGLLGRAVMGMALALIVSVVSTSSMDPIWSIMAVSMVHSLAAHVLATGLTTATTGAVAQEEQGALLGLEHSLFSLARVGGPMMATAILSLGPSGLWSIESVCGVADVLLVVALLVATTSTKSKNP